ncbi:MAG TPA: 7-carboxy-7-deazaguanine synthase QueE [Candidatus Bathyarchaeia archaeon]|nr:7-carboxy-7-deazaguanine synthase QueE [Candidatus Bathyarchaeia archaeon]
MVATANVCEVFNSAQGEGPYVGTRQVFVRFQGCPLTCVYCDAVFAKPYACSGQVKCNTAFHVHNPIRTSELANVVESLWTPATMHLTLTGGEPLLFTEFILELAQQVPKPLYLETNGMDSRCAKRLKNVVNIAACDIKLPEHNAKSNYDSLFQEELRSVEAFYRSQTDVFVKVVVLKQTTNATVDLVAQQLADIGTDVLLVLQPVSHLPSAEPDSGQLLQLMDVAAHHLKRVRVIPQMHKLLGLE